jgi:hypothetical protein
MKAEMSNCSQQELTEYLAEKFSEIYSLKQELNNKMQLLSESVENSDILLTTKEVDILNRSKLPRVLIDASDPTHYDANVYPAEAYKNGSYRWLGPSRLTNFEIPVSRTEEKTVIIKLFSQVRENMYPSVRLYIDGELVEHDIEQQGNEASLYVKLPPSSRVQDTLLTIFTPTLFKPCDLDKSVSDNRLLSVAYSQIEVL